jgi:chromosome partitioning protein
VDPLRSAAVVLGSGGEARSLLLETTAGKLASVRSACARSGCDLLIVDTPPAPEADVRRAIEIADLCLAVSRPSALDLAAVAHTVEAIARAKRPGLIVLNQCPAARGGAETALTRRAEETLKAAKLGVASVRLRNRAAYQHAFANAQAVTEWEPGRHAAADVLRLLAEVGLVLRNAELEAARRRSWLDSWTGGGGSHAPGAGSFEDGFRLASVAPVGAALGDSWI